MFLTIAVQRSETKELDRIPFEDLWQVEPMMRPEDEAMQIKLQEMLQSTTEELKLLTFDLQNINQPSTAIKTERTPLDEDFNEKIYIEELVTSKFNNTYFIKNVKPTLSNDFQSNVKSMESKTAPTTEIGHRYSIISVSNPPKSPRKLSKSKTKIIQLTPDGSKSKLSNEKIKTNQNSNEYYFKYDHELASKYSNSLSMHSMPQVNIRGDFKIQDIFQIEIMPYENTVPQHCANIATVEIHHEKLAPLCIGSNTKVVHTEKDVESQALRNNFINRKVTKISASDSSSSTNSSTEVHDMRRSRNVVNQKQGNSKLFSLRPAGIEKKSQSSEAASFKIKDKLEAENKMSANTTNLKRNNVNNAFYLPYSHLTLGGITLTDLKRAMTEIPSPNMPLSPILDQIISNQEQNTTHDTRAISTSEENLLKDVQDLKYNLTKTLIDNNGYDQTQKNNEKAIQIENTDEDPEYEDDFEDGNIEESKTESQHSMSQPLRKSNKLSLRDCIETHEFIPQVTLKDNETQFNPMNQKSLKITQTSPKAIQPINNVLWPLSTEPNNEVKQAYELEKEIIKKLILEEYGDVINKGNTSASTSTNIHKYINKNTVALQKNTQTSPARVKSVMTSPTRHKTRTTSPVTLNIAVDKETSPQILLVNQTMSKTKSDIEIKESEDLALSLDLSSQKFSLHLPRTSHDVMKNLSINKSYTVTGNSPNVFKYSAKTNNSVHDTSSTTAEVSSSEISSLGEVKHKDCNSFSRKLLSPRTVGSNDSSATSTSSVKHLVKVRSMKSEGEVTNLSFLGNEMMWPGYELRSKGHING